MNPPSTPAELRAYLRSLRAFQARTRQARVDVELSNHPNDDGLRRAEQLRNDPFGPNPFVLGRSGAQRFLEVTELMVRGRLADAVAAPRAQAALRHPAEPAMPRRVS